MKKVKTIWSVLLTAIFCTFTLAGCINESDTATTEIKNEADNFNIVRELTIVNTRTDGIQCKLTGTFSLNMDSTDHQLEIISKIGKDEYRRDLFHINDDTNYYVHNVDKEYEKL